MNESMISRVSRLVSGGLNAFIDAAEGVSPTLVMKEGIREVESAISEIRKELGLSIINKDKLTKSITADKKRHAELLDQIKTAISHEKEDLAEAGVGRQIDLEAQMKVMEEGLIQENKNISKLEGYITALQGKIRDMQDEVKLFEKEEKAIETTQGAENSVSKAEAAFARVAGGERKTSTPSEENEEVQKLKELGDLQRKAKIKTRMAALKSTGN